MKTKLLLLNATANTGSTGRIAEDIGLLAQQSGFEVKLAYGRKAVNSKLPLLKIGDKWGIKWHGVESRLFDNHGFASRNATQTFIHKLELWKPDIINIHNLHGYYLNVELLFDYLKKLEIPVIWTLHDCWSFTGHCAHFERVGCYKWKSECNNCPNRSGYPESWVVDRSKNNFYRKKNIFNGLKNLTIVTPSQWLADHLKYSFLKDYPVRVINNGIDLDVFKPRVNEEQILKKYNLNNKPIILGVANTWKKKKALDDFIKLSRLLGTDYQIVLVGLNKDNSVNLPENITGIARTENQEELAMLYSVASVFVNPTYVDTFPTTNIEALACGTPVITYHTGGSPEAIDAETGFVIKKGDIHELKDTIEYIVLINKVWYGEKCRKRALSLFKKEDRFKDYIELFVERSKI